MKTNVKEVMQYMKRNNLDYTMIGDLISIDMGKIPKEELKKIMKILNDSSKTTL